MSTSASTSLLRLTPMPDRFRGEPVAPPDEWSADSPDGLVHTRSLLNVSRGADAHVQAGSYERLRPIPTGFDALDQWIGNGLRQGELLLIGGAQGVGKTTLCLQMARNIAAAAEANVLYACYEHPEEYVLNRLIVQETIDPAAAGPLQGIDLDELQDTLVRERTGANGLYDVLRTNPIGAKAMATLDRYAGRFHLVADAARKNSVEALEALVAGHRARDDQPLVLFVDYLQKVEPRHRDVPDEAERVTEVVQGLKQLALHSNVAVVAIVAAEKEGLTAPRMRFTHLRGSSALMYEADIAIIMNDKWKIIDRDHIVFNLHKAQQYRDWVICTIEKNRSGKNLVEIEFMKRFEYCCFNPRGGRVAERLYEERIRGEEG
ncbi:MAG TPA: DnaB-like helicase C-terminal domain-containing protein [Thermomicrobiales bacterium]